jgi:hypothetical protein
MDCVTVIAVSRVGGTIIARQTLMLAMLVALCVRCWNRPPLSLRI